MSLFFGLNGRLFLVFIALITIIGANYRFFLAADEQATAHSARVLHTHRVIEETLRFLGHLRDAETGQRGFLLTGDSAYLEPYDSGILGASDSFAALRQLTSDNPLQLSRLQEIQPLMSRKLRELARTIALRREARGAQAMAIVSAGEGKSTMDAMRRLISDFQAEEQRLLSERTRAFEASKASSRRVFAWAGVALLMLALVLSLLVRRKLTNPLIQLTAAVEAVGKGHDPSRIPVMNQHDEIGDLARAFSRMHADVNRHTRELERLTGELEASRQRVMVERDEAVVASITDSLTGVRNRGYMEVELDRLESMSRRYGDDVALVILDIDHFKNVNDSHGHLAGDAVLVALAGVITEGVRKTDLVARYGGEEFVIIMNGTNVDHARETAEKLRSAVEAMSVPEIGGQRVTISLGVAMLSDSGGSARELLSRADAALYHAKSHGRNRVSLAETSA